jgi:hypothetical protein
MIIASATLLAACLAIIGIITGSSLMASFPWNSYH